jgi:4,5-DOPA dioxygenase extradiol
MATRRHAANWAGTAQAQHDSVDLCSLVRSRDGRHHLPRAEDHSRLRRLSPELYRVQYPAPGDVALARRVQKLLSPLDVALDDDWGLNHGTWSVLRHVYPEADIPVMQLSIDETKPVSNHWAIGKKLAPLREEGVLLVGSGNLVHNLRAYAWGAHSRDPYDWAARFEGTAKEMILAGDFEALVDYETLGTDAALSSLLYVLAVAQQRELMRFPVQGVDGGSISMLAVQIG